MVDLVIRAEQTQDLTPAEVDQNFINLNTDKLETQTSVPVKEKITDVAVQSGVVTVDLSSGVEFDVDVDTDITDIQFINTPSDGFVTVVTLRFIQNATGGHQITLPLAITTIKGQALTFSTAVNAIDEVAFKIRNKGGIISITAYPVLEDIK